VIENVDQFSRSPAFEGMLDLLDAEFAEYRVAWQVMNATDYGVPQRRRRTVMIASRVGQPWLPPATHARVPDCGLLRWRTVRDALRGLSVDPYYDRLPERRSELLPGVEQPGPFDECQIHVGRRYGTLMLRRFDHIPPGGGRFDLPEHLMPPCWRRKTSGTTDV